MLRIFNQLCEMESQSLYVLKRKGLCFVFLNNATKLLCQARLDNEDIEFIKLCLSRNVNLMNSNYRGIYAVEMNTITYIEIKDE